MESTVNERIRLLIDYLKISDKKFAEMIGIPQTTLSNLFNRQTEPGYKILNAIMNCINGISSDWLLTGEGEMIRQNIHQTNNQGDNINSGGNLSLDKSVKTNIDPKYVEKLEEDNKRMNQEISKLKDDLLKLQQSMIDLLSKKK